MNCSDHPRNQNAVREHPENLGYARQDLPRSNGQQAGGVNHGEKDMERKRPDRYEPHAGTDANLQGNRRRIQAGTSGRKVRRRKILP